MTLIPGMFSPAHDGAHAPAIAPVPLIDIALWLPEIDLPPRGVRFLIDTGADMTVLNPRDSVRLLSSEQWNAIHQHPAHRVGGAGHGLAHYLVESFLFLTRDDGEVEVEPTTLWIAEPDPLNTIQESLLGRDVLGRFITTFDHVDSIALTGTAQATRR